MSEVVREREASGATFAAVVIMISGGFGIIEGHSLVARRTYLLHARLGSAGQPCDPLRPPN